VPKRLVHDHWLFFTATMLALAGLFMVGSASTHVALDSTQDPSAYLWKHLVNLALGFVGLIAAIVVEVRILMWLLRRKAHLEQSLKSAQGAIQEVIDTEFSAWNLTPAERDVATFLVKGLSTGEIAQMRGSAEGTVKAQLNAIYRKSGSGNRAELMSLLIDTLMGHGKDTAPEPLAKSG